MLRVSSYVKFSYNLVKGSVENRRKFVADLNEQFFDSFQPMLEDKKPFLNDLKNKYNTIIPEKKKIRIIPLKGQDEFEGASDYIYNDKALIEGLTLEIPTKRSKVTEDCLVSLMHENTHVLSTLASPKHTALTQKLYKDGKYNNSRNNWFDNLLYRDECINHECQIDDALSEVRDGTEKFLKGKSVSDKIAHLQDARYELEQEKDAYSEQLKYAKKLKEKGRPVQEEDLVDCDRIYLFTEKIQLLKEMIFDLISEERSKLAKKYGR